MTMPNRSHATTWDGLDVVDDSGAQLGPCLAVFADIDSGMIEWLLVDVEGHRRSFVPAIDAAEVDGRVRLRFSREKVTSAPAVGNDDELAQADEATLYRHYDVPFSDDDSGSLLPEGATAAKPEPVAPAPKPEPVAPAPKPEPVAPAPTLEPVPAPTLEPVIAAPPPMPVTPAPAPEPAAAPGAGSSASQSALAAAAPLAGVGAAVAAVWVVLRARDARQRRRRSLPARTGRAKKQLAAGSSSAAAQASQQLAALSAASAEARKQANKAAARRSKAADKRRRQAGKRLNATTTSLSKRAASVGGAVAGAPGAVADRGRSAGRSMADTLWDAVTLAASGAGYVLGARAGRERYEEITALASSLRARPEVQSAVGTVKETVSTSRTAPDGP